MSDELSTIPNSDMATFSPDELKRAGQLLGVKMDDATALKALIIQRDTGLSLARGEISIVPFKGVNVVFINKNGYLAYAAGNPQYDGFESGTRKDEDGELIGWCRVFRKDRKIPIYVERRYSEYNSSREPWTTKKHTMIEKVAISVAHRQAFPVLNGTYDEYENWIEPKSEPTPVDYYVHELNTSKSEEKNSETESESKAEQSQPPEKKRPANTYTRAQVDKIRQMYETNGWNIKIIEDALFEDDVYDRDMIDEDYKLRKRAQDAVMHPGKNKEASKEEVQNQEQATPAPSPKKASRKSKSEIPSRGICMECGRDAMTSDEIDKYLEELEKLGLDTSETNVRLCTSCAGQFIHNHKLQVSQDSNAQIYKCSECGDTISHLQNNETELFSGKALCKKCESIRSRKA